MAVIMDGKETARKIRENLKGKVDELKIKTYFQNLQLLWWEMMEPQKYM